MAHRPIGCIAWLATIIVCGSAGAAPPRLDDFAKLVPAEKNLPPDWIRSLTARGTPEVFRGADLEKIGMPIGGICSGQLYLGGDGRLWHWDVFNQHLRTGAAHYAKPQMPSGPLEQGFALRVTTGGKEQIRRFRREDWKDVAFRGEYPIGRVTYSDPGCAVQVELEAFSPFVPLQTEDSAFPATVLNFVLNHRGKEPLDVQIAGWLENAIAIYSGRAGEGHRVNKVTRDPQGTFLECSLEPATVKKSSRPDVVFEEFEKPTYEGWEVSGTAFGAGPVEKAKMPAYQGDVGSLGRRLVNSHNTRSGEDVASGDAHMGRLLSREFTLQREAITFRIGGGNHPGQTCMNLLLGDKVVCSATGANNNRMRDEHFDVASWQGQKARLEIVDQAKGSWGNIGIDQIVFTDNPGSKLPLAARPDFGTLVLGMLGASAEDHGAPALAAGDLAAELLAGTPGDACRRPLPERLLGGLKRAYHLGPGESKQVTFVVAWHFPNHALEPVRGSQGRRYAVRFPHARAVANEIAARLEPLTQATRLWHDTWYDSTLPCWFLDRTFLNTSILASSTCHWFADGRFYGWEGVGCCPGTCTHVWHYAQAVARLFPALERDLRERTDFGLAFDDTTGVIRFRGEGAGLAIDGQAGCILRSLREHQMSADEQFLRHNWAKIKRALECLIEQDSDDDGLLTGAQHNTLDADWYGPVAWLSGLYLAALGAGEEMAREVGDAAFAARCQAIVARGRENLVKQLWEGEYFVNRPDPKHPQAINSGTGCEIDQVFGQSWAWQVGLGRVLPEKQTRQALQTLWKYNFTPDVGPYREVFREGRWYAMPGEGGLLMCTFPRPDWDFQKAKGGGRQITFAGYFNECMTGFEYQVAGHMLWERMIQEGLAVVRTIHDRYHPSRRNPWNEVECGDHYARAMASYGVYLAACGFEYHGPRGHLGFAPRLTPEKFRAAFTAAEGWGSLWQERAGGQFSAGVDLKWGRLRVGSMGLELPDGMKPVQVTVTLDGKPVKSRMECNGSHFRLTLPEAITLLSGQAVRIELR